MDFLVLIPVLFVFDVFFGSPANEAILEQLVVSLLQVISVGSEGIHDDAEENTQ